MTAIDMKLFSPLSQAMLEGSFYARPDDPIRRWLSENAAGNWRIVGSTVMLNDETDASMFRIRFFEDIED